MPKKASAKKRTQVTMISARSTRMAENSSFKSLIQMAVMMRGHSDSLKGGVGHPE